MALLGLAMAIGLELKAPVAAAPTYRLVLGSVAHDGNGAIANPQPSPTRTATPTLVPTQTPTRTPMPSATPTPTVTATPTLTAPAGSAFTTVKSWYDHISLTLYGNYSGILTKQSAGQLTKPQAGAQLIAEKDNADAYKAFLDTQGGVVRGASPACDQARQTLALAAGWLGLMEGWGGLILSYGPTTEYLNSRQQASDNYFSFMSEALGLLSGCSGSAGPAQGNPPPTSTIVPTATPTPTYPSGSGFCSGSRTTADWKIAVAAPTFADDLFDIVVTPLTSNALESTLKVRVYDPTFSSSDSGTKYPSYVGQSIRLHYGFDFFDGPPYEQGEYEVQLRVDFGLEARVYVTCP